MTFVHVNSAKWYNVYVVFWIVYWSCPIYTVEDVSQRVHVKYQRAGHLITEKGPWSSLQRGTRAMLREQHDITHCWYSWDCSCGRKYVHATSLYGIQLIPWQLHNLYLNSTFILISLIYHIISCSSSFWLVLSKALSRLGVLEQDRKHWLIKYLLIVLPIS